MKKEAVSNTSSIIFITKLNIFDLVKNMFSKILIPKEVIDEIFEKDVPENKLIKKELDEFIKNIKVKNIKEFPLDKGEQAAISLCLEKNIKTFLSEDKKARNYARSLKIETIGIPGILLWNLKNKKIKKEKCLNLVNELIKKGYYLSPNLYSEIAKIINYNE